MRPDHPTDIGAPVGAEVTPSSDDYRDTAAAAPLDRLGRFFGLLAMALVAVAAPFLLNSTYSRELLIMTCIFGIAAVGLDMVMGQMGQFSFGHAALWGLGGYISALLSLRLELPVSVAIIAASVATGIFGLVLSFAPLIRTRGLELAIITFAFGAILSRVASALLDITGGPAGLLGIPPLVLFGVTFDEEVPTYFLVLTVLTASLYFVHRLKRSKFGRAVRSVRENENLAKSVGISPARHYILIFGISSAVMGLSGALLVHHVRFITPNNLDLSYMVVMVIMVIIGGTDSLLGPVVGAGIYIWGTEILGTVNVERRFLFFGVVLLAAVVFIPRGVVPSLQWLWNHYVRPAIRRSSLFRPRKSLADR